VSTVFLSSAAFQDLLRLEAFLHESEDPLAGELLDFILDALQVMKLNVNGQTHQLDVEPEMPLLWALAR
jgi:hypothetical protein